VTFYPPTPSQHLSSVLDQTPDVITAIQCHHYLQPEGRRRATQECYALLPDGGLYVTFENICPMMEFGVEIALNRWGDFQRAQGRSEATVKEHRQRYNQNYFPLTIPQHLELLHAVGFKIAELFWYSQMQAGFYALK